MNNCDELNCFTLKAIYDIQHYKLVFLLIEHNVRLANKKFLNLMSPNYVNKTMNDYPKIPFFK